MLIGPYPNHPLDVDADADADTDAAASGPLPLIVGVCPRRSMACPLYSLLLVWRSAHPARVIYLAPQKQIHEGLPHPVGPSGHGHSISMLLGRSGIYAVGTYAASRLNHEGLHRHHRRGSIWHHTRLAPIIISPIDKFLELPFPRIRIHLHHPHTPYPIPHIIVG